MISVSAFQQLQLMTKNTPFKMSCQATHSESPRSRSLPAISSSCHSVHRVLAPGHDKHDEITTLVSWVSCCPVSRASSLGRNLPSSTAPASCAATQLVARHCLFWSPPCGAVRGQGLRHITKNTMFFDFLFLLLVVFIFLFFPSSFECSITIVQLFKESKNAWCIGACVWHFNRAIFEQHVQLSRLESASSPGGLSLNSTTVRLTLSGRQFSPHVPVFRWCLGVPGELSHVLVCCLGYIWYMDHGYIYIYGYMRTCAVGKSSPRNVQFSSLPCSHFPLCHVLIKSQSCSSHVVVICRPLSNHVLIMSFKCRPFSSKGFWCKPFFGAKSSVAKACYSSPMCCELLSVKGKGFRAKAFCCKRFLLQKFFSCKRFDSCVAKGIWCEGFVIKK